MPFLNDTRKSGIGIMVLSGTLGLVALDANHFAIHIVLGIIFVYGLLLFLEGEQL
jgi:hypothetical protein